MPLLPFGEWRPDVSDYQQQFSSNITNAVARGDGYGPIRALNVFSQALNGPCRGSYLATDDDGTIAVFAGTNTALYKLDNTDLSWEDVSGDTYNLSQFDLWQFKQFGSDVIAVNQNDPPQRYTVGSSTDFADLAGSPPQAQHIDVVANHLVLSGILNNPDRVAWSALNDITTWTSGTNGADFQDFQDGGEVQSVAGGEFGVVFQKEAIRRMVFVGGDEIFEFERVVDGEGLAAHYSVIRSGARTFFLGTSGFQMITAGQYPVNISKERFHRTFLADFDDSAIDLMQGVNEARSSRVWWFYKSLTGADGVFNRAICYDWELDKASYITGITGEHTAVLSQPGVTLEGLVDFGYTNIDTMEPSFDSFAGSSGLLLGVFDASHQLGFLSGNTLEATLETGDYAFDRRFFVRGQRPISDASTIYGSFTIQQRVDDAPVRSSESAMNVIGFCPHRGDTRITRFQHRIPAGETWTYDTGTEVDATTTGMK